MIPYIFLIIFTLTFIPLCRYNSKLYLYINYIIICLFMALRSPTVGSDTLSYRSFFYNSNMTDLPNNFINWILPLNNQRFETGFILLNKLIYNISPNFQFELFVTAFIISTCFIFFIKQLNCDYPLSFLIFICLGFLANSMNLMRQSLAWAFTLVAFVFVVKRKFFPFIIFVVLAGSMQVTGFLFLPVYFLSYCKLNYRSLFLIAIGGGVVFFDFEKIFGSISKFSTEVQTFSSSINNGDGHLNLILNLFIFGIVFFCSYRLLELSLKDKENLLVKNSIYLSLLAIACIVISFKFSQIFRIVMYFASCEFILITYIVNKFNNKFLFKAIIITALICYFIIIQMIRPEWSYIIPYLFFWQS